METINIIFICLAIWFLIGFISSVIMITSFDDITGENILIVCMMSLGGLITTLVAVLMKHEKTIFFKKRK